jgi:hypothetical protein
VAVYCCIFDLRITNKCKQGCRGYDRMVVRFNRQLPVQSVPITTKVFSSCEREKEENN